MELPFVGQRLLPIGLMYGLVAVACPVALADEICSDPAVQDFFVQGGQIVLGESHLKITSLGQEEEVAGSDTSLICRYEIELSDHSKRWVRFTYLLDKNGQPAIEYEEEEKVLGGELDQTRRR